MYFLTGSLSLFLGQVIFLTGFFCRTISATRNACPAGIQDDLKCFLSNNASVSSIIPSNFRWSDYAEPHPSVYVKVGTEADVSSAIRYANQHDYPFLVQNGGNGVGTNFNLTDCGLLLDISRLNHVSFNDDKTEAHIQGGVTVKDLVSAAARNNARVATATCNCLGFLGAALGGGLTRTDGLYGLSVDQLISATVVLASGEIVRTRNTTHPDLWWAIRGAAANFGVVTSAVIKAYPVPAHQNMSWEGSISFSGDKVKQVLEVLSKLKLRPNMQFDFNFLTSGAPSYTPGISIVPFFVGNDSAARAAFAPVLDLGPTNVSVSEVPYNHWNGAGDAFCTKGGRKPGHGASLAHIDVESWISIYRSYEKFIASNRTAFGSSFVLAEIYPLPNTPKHEAATSSYPFRDLPIVVGINPVYSDAALDATAIAWAAEIRSMLWTTAGTAHNSCYINFAFGDESLSTIYGESLPRLQRLKRKYDPENRFNQWFPLTATMDHLLYSESGETWWS